LANAYTVFSTATVGAGATITARDALYVQDCGGSGTLTTQTGLRIKALAKGATNWAIYTEGATASQFEGAVSFAQTNNTAFKTTISTVQGAATYNANQGYHYFQNNGSTIVIFTKDLLGVNIGSASRFTWSSTAAPNETTDTSLGRNGVGIVAPRGSTTTTPAAMEFYTYAASPPAAPAASMARLYSDTSGGKIRLMALFPSGAAQQIAIEP